MGSCSYDIFQVKRELAPIQESDKKKDKPTSPDNTDTKANSLNQKTVLPPITTKLESDIPVKNNEENIKNTGDSDNNNDTSIQPNDWTTKETNSVTKNETEAEISPRDNNPDNPVDDGKIAVFPDGDRCLLSGKKPASSVTDSCKTVSTGKTLKADPHVALFSSYLHPINYHDSSQENLLYMLALNEEEIETYEYKKKQVKMKKRLRSQCKDNGNVYFKVKEWVKKCDEERRAKLVEIALREAAEVEAREKRRKEREKEKKKSNFKTDVYSSDEES